ncbi:MAG: ATP-binding protein [Casimicrobiaceae bacterium]|nr:ATP-binding protein [Casimicrobiaceae bacterium]
MARRGSEPEEESSGAALVAALRRIAEAIERLSPAPPEPPDFARVLAAVWKSTPTGGCLVPIEAPDRVELERLVAIEAQLAAIDRNTRAFVRGWPANHVLLTGARGTGKSSLVKAMLTRYAAQGLRLIEVSKDELAHLAQIVALVRRQPYRFVVFCDDLAFDSGDASYRALKAALDGSVAGGADNVLVYATSNRRHLMPEYFRENAETRYVGEEIHFGESIEEKISLSERFGLWIPFYPFTQEDYLAAVERWIEFRRGRPIDTRQREALFREALQWALARGSRSGRVAEQFARDWLARRAGAGKPPGARP